MSQVEANVTLFKNHHGNVNVVLPSCKTVPFLLDPESGQGKFFTADKKLERELTWAAEEGEFGIFIDPADSVIDLNAATPMEQLEKKIRSKLMAELAAGGKLVDAGVSFTTPQQMQASMSNTTSVPGAGMSEEALALQATQAPAPVLVDSNGQVIKPTDTVTETAPTTETIQPTDATSPALSALEKLKLGKTS